MEETGGRNQQRAAEQLSPSAVTEVQSLSHADVSSLLPLGPLSPRGRPPVKLQLQHLSPRVSGGQLRGRKTHNLGSSASAGFVPPRSPPRSRGQALAKTPASPAGSRAATQRHCLLNDATSLSAYA
ncbi:hypothetical protein NDU88_003351 [Pleurodeles waltl]|uniref:Uncharacterized protein n=1 Tax=Pleurodeles waltl TaxID=8319 RepID=A0AAV7WRE5_PLEWA|nr:hypothetical protein NDU88_003351 [Pleurodeles waltl]